MSEKAFLNWKYSICYELLMSKHSPLKTISRQLSVYIIISTLVIQLICLTQFLPQPSWTVCDICDNVCSATDSQRLLPSSPPATWLH